MGYIVAGILSLIFLIWLVWFEFHDKEKHLEAKEQMENHFKSKKTIQNDKDGKIQCPHCGSTNIQIVKRGWKVTTGFLGSSKNERVCINCMKKY